MLGNRLAISIIAILELPARTTVQSGRFSSLEQTGFAAKAKNALRHESILRGP